MTIISFSVSDEDLKKRIEEAGRLIREKYCYKMPNQPTMLPPIPNCSKFIDKFPDEGCTEDIEADRRKQEAYAAEVKVYRALESLQENIVVLHSLHYTNRQLRLFKKDHQFEEDKPSKEAGECDFVVIGEHYVVVIEVSDVRIDEEITSNKRIKTAFNRKKKQAARTKELVDLIMNPSESGATSNVRWFCAFHSISSEIGAKLFQPEQTRNIIFSDFLDTSIGLEEYQNNFQLWWIKNGLSTRTRYSRVAKSSCGLTDQQGQGKHSCFLERQLKLQSLGILC